MRNLAWMVTVLAALGCGNNLVVPGSGGSGGHGGLAGASGATGGSASVAGHGGLAGASGATGGSASVVGHGGLGGAGGAMGGSLSCLQDLWASCGYSSTQCYTDYDAGTSSWCFESGASFSGAGFTVPPCSATDGGGVEQVLTPFKKPDGSPCYVLRLEFSNPYSSGGSCNWGQTSYTWMDATGSTIATWAYGPADFVDVASFTCTDGGSISCTRNPDNHSLPGCPTVQPYCYGPSGTCPFPRDAASQ